MTPATRNLRINARTTLPNGETLLSVEMLGFAYSVTVSRLSAIWRKVVKGRFVESYAVGICIRQAACCTCPDHLYRHGKNCKHMDATTAYLAHQSL